jgi:hypothetical protein
MAEDDQIEAFSIQYFQSFQSNTAGHVRMRLGEHSSPCRKEFRVISG